MFSFLKKSKKSSLKEFNFIFFPAHFPSNAIGLSPLLSDGGVSAVSLPVAHHLLSSVCTFWFRFKVWFWGFIENCLFGEFFRCLITVNERWLRLVTVNDGWWWWRMTCEWWLWMMTVNGGCEWWLVNEMTALWLMTVNDGCRWWLWVMALNDDG